VALSRGTKTGIVASVFTVMLVVAGYGAYNIWSALGKDDGAGANSPSAMNSPISSAPPSAKEIHSAATAFLAAWASGDDTKASALTDSPQTAGAALASYRSDGHVTSLKITPTTESGDQVSYDVAATVSAQGITKPWSYTATLTAVRSYGNKVVVKWQPSVLHPDLGPGESIVTGVASLPDVDIVDRNGHVMDLSAYPSLGDIADQLRSRYGAALKGQGTPPVETYIAGDDGTPDKALVTLRKGVSAHLRTTLDPAAQAAAEKAVTAHPNSGVTALDTRTGGILAVAFNPSGSQNLALQSLEAPGSTFKVVTATALLNTGKVTPSTHSQCVDGYAAKGGKPYHNVTPDNRNADFAWDFANSCNTGFIRLSDDLTPSSLTSTGRTYYGLGATWYTGVSTSDGSIPGGTGDEKTSEMIGQGQVVMTTLNMASVSATVVDGRFHQPTILQDTRLIKNRADIGTSPLPAGVQYDLKLMMHKTVTSGTAYAAMHTLSGTVGAKTGSAEHGTGTTNGWFTGYRNHVAAAAMVLNGGEGVDSAGPIVASVLASTS
jgi:hypothetical protein